MPTHRIVVEVDDQGRVEATLWLDDTPLAGHSDSIGTLAVDELLRPLVADLAHRCEMDRTILTRAA